MLLIAPENVPKLPQAIVFGEPSHPTLLQGPWGAENNSRVPKKRMQYQIPQLVLRGFMNPADARR